MNGVVTISARTPDFQRAFVAMRYFWGARDEVLSDALEAAFVLPATADLLAGLRQPERAARAQVLARELGQLSQALDQRGLVPC